MQLILMNNIIHTNNNKQLTVQETHMLLCKLGIGIDLVLFSRLVAKTKSG